MAEYIKREDAIKATTGAKSLGNTAFSDKYYIATILRSLPAADVVPVVRCRECRYAYDSVGGWCCSHGICVDCVVREYFFCADGARMDGEENV